MHKPNESNPGFTIVELLIVIVVIAILAAISIVAYTGIQQRARDSRRVNDIAQIKKALLLYDAVHGGVVQPGSPGYTKPTDEPTMAGWDVSTSESWLLFLRDNHGSMPVDPVNIVPNPVTTTSVGGNRLYAYYCYPANTGIQYALPDGSATATLRYITDSGEDMVEKIRISACLTTIPS